MEPIYLRLLDEIERKELLSLTWGYVDGSLSRQEAIRLSAEVLRGASESGDAEDLLEELVERRLVFEVHGNRIRSRIAESVRLLSRLKQLFSEDQWYGAPRLVSDFRIDIRRRRYPRRNRPARTVAAERAGILGATALRRSLWHALTGDPELTLAAFQERSLLRLLDAPSDAATIVTAGTGSGKTLAFYLPALLQISDHIQAGQYWVKVLAIYPRIELLKDQLAEAFRRARMMDTALLSDGRRCLSVGGLFSATPNSASARDVSDKWQKRGSAYVCPWLGCQECGGELLWHESDIAAKVERLVCSTPGCHTVIDESQLVLTRTALMSRPPDILFTTTEMLNQRMSDLRMRSLFGLGQPNHRKPRFALLDEVHTCVGTSGAQAALVLRRWRHLLAAPVTWCGLSATLREATRFFADLTGVLPEKVMELTPHQDEMTEEGAEYQLVVRGDPMLQASLLSSTIQASMLLGRIMDRPDSPISDGVFGRRLFVFTDNLDVINRLFDNLRDAEAYTIFGKPNPAKSPLAFLRRRLENDPTGRDAEGQRWRACEQIGHRLDERLIVGRTSSQDSGVLAKANVVVATASLEVGYNDQEVGAVIQHKAPHNMASFLQRKGRAGRQRGMRPLMITMLSDYGRDRVAFQAYEHLFDPVLPPQHLPILNQYVLRMQAVFSTLDWLAAGAVASGTSGWIWNILSKPDNNTGGQVQESVKGRLTSLVRGDAQVLASLREHLRMSLGISVEVVDSLLWEPPRSLLLEAIPTLVRRYFHGWRLAHPTESQTLDLQVDYHPLPDFIPRNLFSDLSLPEVQVMLPASTVNAQPRQEALPIVQALQQLAPGRVTRRFAFERGGLYHWFPIDPEASEQSIEIDRYCERHEALGVFEGYRGDGSVCQLPVYRPWSIRLGKVPREVVLPTSNAFPVWLSGFVPNGTPVVIDVPRRSSWPEYVSGINFFLHRFRSSVAVRRFSSEVNATVRRTSGEKLTRVRYTNAGGEPIAVGFEIEVDGFYVDFQLPSTAELLASQLPAELTSSSRIAYHRYRFLSDTDLPQEVNTLQREWMHQIFVSASLSRASQDNSSLGQAALALLKQHPKQAFSEVMRTLFAIPYADHETSDFTESNEMEEVDAGEAKKQFSRLEERLNEGFDRPEILGKLAELAPELDTPDPIRFGDWMRRTVQETLAEALLQACINTAPRHAAIDTLVSDLELREGGQVARIWVTETTLGGAGVIQAFADTFAREPHSLFHALEAALAPTDLELASNGLIRFLGLVEEDSEICNLTAAVRSNSDHTVRAQHREQLYHALAKRGVDISHALSVSLNTRLLRAGMDSNSDRLLRELVTEWARLEGQYGIAIGLREFCYLAIRLPGTRGKLNALVSQSTGGALSDGGLIQVLCGLLWPRGIEIRQRALQSYNPFRERRLTDPALVRSLLLAPRVSNVSISEPDWQATLAKRLAEDGVACLVAEDTHKDSHSGDMRAAVVRAISAPVNVGFLQFFPTVDRVDRNNVSTKVTLVLREHI
ncbi:putative ATP-dependent helicase Lhr [Caballeronia glebae]|uniref:ATP-dependent helicase Lhr n=1 Tax=Caballeronia glebae TaxID=1777143 RepID=A0A158D249_9BURK|nr:protein DpdJ [Caballeronia glebae]SAK87907.1 putative ATP-dependent helicase Lhr [Caballeronia glebae]